jgi:DNA end-binding protein Ku
MPRAMWRGAIQFGLVTIPVRLFLATEARRGLSFNMLHAEDNKRIQMKTHCPDHGEIKRSDTVRGYEWSKGQYVVLEESDFEAVPLKTVRAIEIEQFVPARRERGGASFVKQSYYLEPEPVGRKAFQLLKSVLAESELQAVCKIVLKDRE